MWGTIKKVNYWVENTRLVPTLRVGEAVVELSNGWVKTSNMSGPTPEVLDPSKVATTAVRINLPEGIDQPLNSQSSAPSPQPITANALLPLPASVPAPTTTPAPSQTTGIAAVETPPISGTDISLPAPQAGDSVWAYAALVKAAIKLNVVFNEEIIGNPMAKIEVTLAPDSTIITQRLLSSSGNKAWDDAAMIGIIRTRVVPRDVFGRIPDTTLILEMRPMN